MSDFQDNFDTRIPLDYLNVVLDLGVEFRFDPTSSVEMEDYWARLLGEFNGPGKHLEEWLRPKVVESFRTVSSRPEWIQNPDWQVSDEGPMTFVGQVNSPAVDGVFHDDASFYVFFDPKSGEIRTVMQIA